MQQAINIQQQIRQQHSSPVNLMKIAGNILFNYPSIQPTQLDWRATQDPPPAANRYVASENKTQSHPVLQNSLIVSGNIQTGAGGIRQSIETLDRLVIDISSSPAIEQASIINYPLEIDPQKTLLGGKNLNANSSDNLGAFSIHIIGAQQL